MQRRGGPRHETLEPMRPGVTARFGAVGKDGAVGLSLRQDHGSRYMSHDFRAEIRWPGVTTSPAFFSASEGTNCAERFIRTTTEKMLRIRTVDTVEDLRAELIAFRQTCKKEWLIQEYSHHSPAQFRRNQFDAQTMAA